MKAKQNISPYYLSKNISQRLILPKWEPRVGTILEGLWKDLELRSKECWLRASGTLDALEGKDLFLDGHSNLGVFGSFHPAKRFEAFRGSMHQRFGTHAPKIWHWCRLSIIFPSATATIHNNIILELQASSHSSRSRSKASRQLRFWISCSCSHSDDAVPLKTTRSLQAWCSRPFNNNDNNNNVNIYIYLFIYLYMHTHTHIYIYIILLVFCTWNETVLPVWSKLVLLIVMVLKTSCRLRGPRIQDIGVPEAYLSW